jgi:hypothetical protein
MGLRNSFFSDEFANCILVTIKARLFLKHKTIFVTFETA